MKNKEQNFVSAVVYTRNAEKNIEFFINNLNDVLNAHFKKYEIIIVNDGSIDNTVNIIKEVSKTIKSSIISIINMSHFQGRELSMNAGVDLAIGDFVYEFDDTTIDYEKEIIFTAYEKALEGYDIVNVTSSANRRITSSLFYTIFNKYSNYQYKIDTDTFRITSRRAINRVNAINKTNPYRKASLANCGLKLVTIKYKQTILYTRNIDKPEKIERENNALDALILFTNVCYKTTINIIRILILITLLVIAYTVYIFLSQTPIQGWTTTMLFMSFGFLGIFFVFAIIIKYLSLLINLCFKKSNYLVESVEKLN